VMHNKENQTMSHYKNMNNFFFVKYKNMNQYGDKKRISSTLTVM
jgi:hypothetical protein